MQSLLISALLLLGLIACSNNNSDGSSIRRPSAPSENSSVAPADGKSTANATTAQTCKAQGGSWQPVCMLGRNYCILSYADAGKACTDSSQCQGKCLVVPDRIQTTGQCQLNNNPCGCFSTMEHGQPQPGLCID